MPANQSLSATGKWGLSSVVLPNVPAVAAAATIVPPALVTRVVRYQLLTLVYDPSTSKWYPSY